MSMQESGAYAGNENHNWVLMCVISVVSIQI